MLNSDSIILNRQEAAHIRKAGVDLTAYLEGFAARNYMPTKSDLLVKAFRSWFASAGGLPFDLRDTLHALGERSAAATMPARGGTRRSTAGLHCSVFHCSVTPIIMCTLWYVHTQTRWIAMPP